MEEKDLREEEDVFFGEDIELEKILSLLRVASGWSESALAEKTGLSPRTITEYERGTMTPGVHSIQKLLQAQGYPFAALDYARTFIAILGLVRRRHFDVKASAELRTVLEAFAIRVRQDEEPTAKEGKSLSGGDEEASGVAGP